MNEYFVLVTMYSTELELCAISFQKNEQKSKNKKKGKSKKYLKACRSMRETLNVIKL